jgi:hypothetical protein
MKVDAAVRLKETTDMGANELMFGEATWTRFCVATQDMSEYLRIRSVRCLIPNTASNNYCVCIVIGRFRIRSSVRRPAITRILVILRTARKLQRSSSSARRYSPGWALASLTISLHWSLFLGFLTIVISTGRGCYPVPKTPNLEDQDILLCLASPLRPVWHGWPYQ